MNDTVNFLPHTYAEWRHCITVKCGLRLTRPYIEGRLEALRNNSDEHTQRFIALYGHDYHERVVNWFYKAQME